jgi:hypothetical protein
MIKLAELLNDMTPAQKKFAALAPPKDKITFADKIAGAKNKKRLKKEGDDHEVSMAQASLKSIISSASQLMNKLGNTERDIPGWIQDHITNAENYIDQAAQGFHELNDNE